MAATPCAAFLVAVSMLGRRAAASRQHGGAAPSPGLRAVPDQDEAQALPSPAGRPSRTEADTLLESARRAADEHQQHHGQPITRDMLRARLGISNQLASDLLHQIRAPEGEVNAPRPVPPAAPPSRTSPRARHVSVSAVQTVPRTAAMMTTSTPTSQS